MRIAAEIYTVFADIIHILKIKNGNSWCALKSEG